MRHHRVWLFVLVVLLATTVVTGAEPLTSIPNPRIRDGTWVTDMPGMLRADTIAQLNSTISDFERTTGGEMAVVVIGSLDGLSIEEAAVQLFNTWGIGKKSNDNGLLFLWSTATAASVWKSDMGSRAFFPTARPGRFSIPTLSRGSSRASSMRVCLPASLRSRAWSAASRSSCYLLGVNPMKAVRGASVLY
jgi:hypothetical protein